MKYTIAFLAAATLCVPAAGWADDHEEIQAFAMVQNGTYVSLGDAIRTAQERVSGVAIEAEFDADNSFSPVYKIELVDPNGVVWDVFVDPTNGEVGRVREDDDRERVPATTVSILDAIATAEAHQGGKAMSAELDDEGFRDVFAIEVVQDIRVFDVYISAEDGSVLGSRQDHDD